MVTDASDTGKAIPVVTGAATGVISFIGLVLWFGLPIFPNNDKLPSRLIETRSPYPTMAAASGPTDPGEATYQTVCAACHQANGQGLPGAFPPLAESEWVTGDPETFVRIVLAGLTGPITVKGQPFNAMMPPPPGLDDEKIAAVVTFVRSRFNNKASAVDKAKVAEVRASLAGRATPWTAAELQALRKPGDAKPAAEQAAPAAAAPGTPGGPTPTPPPDPPKGATTGTPIGTGQVPANVDPDPVAPPKAN